MWVQKLITVLCSIYSFKTQLECLRAYTGFVAVHYKVEQSSVFCTLRFLIGSKTYQIKFSPTSVLL